MSNRLVCLCNFITEKEILTALKKGADSTPDIQYLTKAGTSCGKCLPEIDAIVENYLQKKQKNEQHKLDF